MKQALSKAYLLQAAILLGLIFNPEDGGDVIPET
jgi:hypothetical protein